MKTLFNDGWLFAKTVADHSKENGRRCRYLTTG